MVEISGMGAFLATCANREVAERIRTTREKATKLKSLSIRHGKREDRRRNACPARWTGVLEVEFQGKLYLSSVLCGADDTVARVRFCKVRVVEKVQEVRAELQSLRLSEREVLLQTQINICVAGPNHWTLSGTVAEGAWWRV